MKRLWLILLTVCVVVVQANNAPVGASDPLAFYVPPPEPVVEKFFLYSEGKEVGVTELDSIGRSRVPVTIAPILRQMIKDACDDGVMIIPNSAYRSREEQIELRVRYARYRRLRNDSTYILYARPNQFSPEVAKPGYSKHQLGTAFDFYVRDRQAFYWLKANAARYGFIRTIKSERWHWEYVECVEDMYTHVPANHWSWK